jgi:hypothetical protein
MAGITLNAVKAAAVNGHHGTLHVDEIVLAQTASSPFMFLNKHCATLRLPAPELRRLEVRGLQPLRSRPQAPAPGSTLQASGFSQAEDRANCRALSSPEPGARSRKLVNQRFLTASSTCLASAS